MENKNVTLLVTAFVALIVGVSLIGVIASEEQAITRKTVISNETRNLATSCIVANQINESDADCNITVTNYPTSWKINDCPLTSISVKNLTGTTLTVNTDYRAFASTGIIQMLNTTATDAGDFNTTAVYYSYCKDNYLNAEWNRTVLNLVAGFFAIALLLISVGLFYQVMKTEGIINI